MRLVRPLLSLIAFSALHYGGVLPPFMSPQALPELPRQRVTFAQPVPRRVVQVPKNADLQRFIDQAQPGDALVLPAGSSFTGTFTLRNKGGSSEFITLISNKAAALASGRRVTAADALNMPRLIGRPGLPTITTESGAHHYALIGLEVVPATTGLTYQIINLGDVSTKQATSDSVPHSFLIDRLWIHGYPANSTRNGIAMNSGRTQVVNTLITEIHQSGDEAHGIICWNGPGPFRIENNRIEASTINIMFGGAVPMPNLVPSDIEIVGNHLFKPLSWRSDDPSFTGIAWPVKNVLEFKNARRVLVTGNVLENNWTNWQSGFAVLVTIRTEHGAALWNVVEDITLRSNLIRNSPGGFSVLGRDSDGTGSVSRIYILNNLLQLTDRWAIQVLQWPSFLTLNHNTTVWMNATNTGVGGLYIEGGTTGLTMVDNIFGKATCSVCGAGTVGSTTTFARYAPGAILRHNGLVGTKPDLYDQNNFFLSTNEAVRWTGPVGDRDIMSAKLDAFSPLVASASDGTNVGVDVSAMISAGAR